MLSTVLLHMVEATGPVDLQSGLDTFFDWGGGVVDMAGADTLHIPDLDRFVQRAVVARLSTTLWEQDCCVAQGSKKRYR